MVSERERETEGETENRGGGSGARHRRWTAARQRLVTGKMEPWRGEGEGGGTAEAAQWRRRLSDAPWEPAQAWVQRRRGECVGSLGEARE